MSDSANLPAMPHTHTTARGVVLQCWVTDRKVNLVATVKHLSDHREFEKILDRVTDKIIEMVPVCKRVRKRSVSRDKDTRSVNLTLRGGTDIKQVIHQLMNHLEKHVDKVIPPLKDENDQDAIMKEEAETVLV